MISCVTSTTKKRPSGAVTSTRLTTPSQKLCIGLGGWKWTRTLSPTATSVAIPSDIHGRSTVIWQALRSPHGRLSAVGDTDLSQDSFDMHLDRRLCDIEPAGDDLVRLSFR